MSTSYTANNNGCYENKMTCNNYLLLPNNILVPWCLYILLDLHLSEMRQLFKDARGFQHSEFIVVQAPSNRAKGDQGQRGMTREPMQKDATNTSVTHSSAVY